MDADGQGTGFAMADKNTYALSLTDRAIEKAIDTAYHELATAKTEPAQRSALERMQALIAMRSPRRVLHMETERGLR